MSFLDMVLDSECCYSYLGIGLCLAWCGGPAAPCACGTGSRACEVCLALLSNRIRLFLNATLSLFCEDGGKEAATGGDSKIQ